MSDAATYAELEVRIAYQDDTIEKLSDELYRQGQALARLEERCRLLEQQVIQLRESKNERPLDDERPPHY